MLPPILAQRAKWIGSELTPEPAILAASDKHEVVAMPEAHGLKEMDERFPPDP